MTEEESQARLCFLSATELARMIRAREVTSVQVVRAHLDRIHRLNAGINAVVDLRAEDALARAARADEGLARGEVQGPLHGVPITIKDVHRVAGFLSTYGLPQFRNYRASSDSWIADRVRRSGAIILGRTNVPVAGFDWQTWNPIYGRTLNPWDTGRVAGGSSGGAAAAVALGLVPLDIGSDIAGSIRYPAHCCGVLGLRPTDGLVPNWRMHAEGTMPPFRNLLTSGPLARSYDDLRLGLAVLAGEGWSRLEAGVTESKLRIGWSDELPGMRDLPLGAETREHLGRFLEEAKARGHQVEKVVPPGIDFDEVFRLWGEIAGFEFAAALPIPLRPRFMRWLAFGTGFSRWLMGKGNLLKGARRGITSGAQGYFRALARRDELMMEFQKFFDGVDVWITPSSPTEAIPHQKVGREIEFEGRKIQYSDFLAGWLSPFTTLGHPIVSAPVGLVRSGMPVSLQFHGPRFGDLRLVNITEALLPALPFSHEERFGPAVTA